MIYTYNNLTMRYELPQASEEHIRDFNLLIDALAESVEPSEALPDTWQQPEGKAPELMWVVRTPARQRLNAPHEGWTIDPDGTLRSPDGFRAGVDPEGNFVRL